ncbi:MAG: 4Fe-4S binding protein [Bacteroidales bacterium]|nr:4Fe-4S binding protein [Bacteroidales bacterium]
MKKRLVLTFPANRVNEPVTYRLIKDFDILVNILNADITPGRKGKLLVELKASKENIDSAIEYIESTDIQWSPAVKSIQLDYNNCIHCGACSSVCFAGALEMDKHSRKLIFAPENCIACELCLKACPLQLFDLKLT